MVKSACEYVVVLLFSPGEHVHVWKEFFRFVGSGKRPSDIAGGIPYRGAHRVRSSLLVISQSFHNNRNNCSQARERERERERESEGM